MNGLSPEIERQINRYRPVIFEGITIYPVTVEHYEIFTYCTPALGFMQQSLPVAMLAKPLISVFFEMELAEAHTNEPSGDNGEPDDKPGNLFTRSMIALVLALRLGEGQPMQERLTRVLPTFDRKTGKKLQSLIVITDGGKPVEISPAKFGRLRPVIAAQNGIEIPPLDANPELVEADRAVRMMNAPKLEMVLEDKVSFVALASGADEDEIYDWPILKFNRRSIAAERVLSYLIYGIGEHSGMVKYKNGNPCPSPYFRRKQQSLGMVALSEFRRGAEQEINKAHQNNE